jgi:hypothetical protein
MSDWQPIATAPKDGTDVLLFAREGECAPSVYVGRWSTSAWYGAAWVAYEHRSETEYLTPTHWMPLPAPPTTGEPT